MSDRLCVLETDSDISIDQLIAVYQRVPGLYRSEILLSPENVQRNIVYSSAATLMGMFRRNFTELRQIRKLL